MNQTRQPSTTKQKRRQFSIFNPAITLEHREFYETIVNRLNGIFPLCSQGKSASVEISENATERQQVTDLMKQVEQFAADLLEVNKELFNQFYQSKEDLHQAILGTTAYNTINLIDRNLLERTCDVRWWALELAFSDCISFALKTKEQASQFSSQTVALKEQVLLSKKQTTLKIGGQKSTHDLVSKIEELELVWENPVMAILRPERQEQIKKLSDENNHQASQLGTPGLETSDLETFHKNLNELHVKLDFANSRLEDINNSYTLYRDIVIVGPKGYIIANSNPENREKVIGLNVATESWFDGAMKTLDGNTYHSQDVQPSAVEQQQSLVYSTAIRENSDEHGAIIGAMGVFFDFQGEADIILNEYIPKDEDNQPIDGCYSLFTNQQGQIIASSDNVILPAGSFAHIPKAHRNLDTGKKIGSYTVFEGIESALVSCKTEGYLEYSGLGWTAHLVIPKEDVFKSDVEQKAAFEIDEKLLTESCLIPAINQETFLKVQDDKEAIQLVSLNGIVFASKLGRRGVALGPIFQQVTKTGSFATQKMEELLEEMALGVFNLYLKSLENFSKQGIDILDRNLFERSADIRWWATDKIFWNTLQHPSEEEAKKAANRLRVINGSYTMYRNLVLIDAQGEFVACSRSELERELKQTDFADQTWFQEAMRARDSSEYHVADISPSTLEKKKEASLIYVGAVRANGGRQGEVIGVLAILFDWDKEAKAILQSCLPQTTDGEPTEGVVGFYTNSKGNIIETTEPKQFPLGKHLSMPPEFHDLQAGESKSGFVQFGDQAYIMGVTQTKGYREYAGLNWCAHILRPVFPQG